MTPPAPASPSPVIAIACGGTGGHLFPGLAVAQCLARRGCEITLLISPKDIDQQAVKGAPPGVRIVTLPAVGLSRGRRLAFVRGFIRSYRAAREHFRKHPPGAALAMGGFTAAPPVLAAKRAGARTFLHESNTIPGRANRWLARLVDGAFVGFPQAASRLRVRPVTTTGTPVRPQFRPLDPAPCRAKLFGVSLGVPPSGGAGESPAGGTLDSSADPVLLVMGGSQGASGINELVVKALPLLATAAPRLRLIHLAGPVDAERIRAAAAALNLEAVVQAFLPEMELALGAATLSVSRAGASSLAELAAMRVPALLIPYPAATDNHQFHNARAFVDTGAARMLEQSTATPEILVASILEMLADDDARERMQIALAKWHAPGAAELIAEKILSAVPGGVPAARAGRETEQPLRGVERHDFSAARS